ncbi:MAG TPA: YigZ family protein [Trueperaceae bacterium]
MAHRTAARVARLEETVKGSRFLAFVRPLACPEEFEGWLAGLRDEHGDASHHCWAYRFGADMRFSDDGEPGGTAGRPMLEVLLKRDLDRLGVVVVRYFGGTKLGAGGLVRAYGGAVAKALDEAGEKLVEDVESLEVHVPFALVDALHRLLAQTRQARTTAEQFDGSGWRVRLEVPATEAADFRARLADLTRGAATVGTALEEGSG